LPALRPRDLAASSLARAAHAASEDAPLAVGLRVPPSVLERAPRRAAAEKGRAAPPAVADLYSNRFGPRKTDALERFGGTAETERAVAQGLAYLARVQQRRGHWGRMSREDEKYGQTWVGKTALCTLAFLGAGHTHRSGT